MEEPTRILHNVRKSRFGKLLYRKANSGLDWLDYRLAPSFDAPCRYPPIFVLGAPRCGSTLLFQVITEAFDIGYLSNAHARWYGSPALAERLLRPLASRPPPDYQSRHGVTHGRSAPSECAPWWYRFFRRDPAFVPLGEENPEKMRRFRRSLLAISEAFAKPVVFKNLYAGLRMQPIIKYVPEALFIIIRRDEIANGHSLLKGREAVFGNYETWWSVPPPNVETLKRQRPAAQVILQIREIYRQIESDLQPLADSDRAVLHINYEEFCVDPHGQLARLGKFLMAKHGNIRPDTTRIPTSFPMRSGVQIDEGVYDEMVNYSQATRGREQ